MHVRAGVTILRNIANLAAISPQEWKSNSNMPIGFQTNETHTAFALNHSLECLYFDDWLAKPAA
jgi:hypothetical protein